MKSLSDDCYYVLAAAMPLPAARQGFLLPDCALLVGMGQNPLVVCNGKVSGLPDIVLRVPFV
jgi:hypothetical protein